MCLDPKIPRWARRAQGKSVVLRRPYSMIWSSPGDLSILLEIRSKSVSIKERKALSKAIFHLVIEWVFLPKRRTWTLRPYHRLATFSTLLLSKDAAAYAGFEAPLLHSFIQLLQLQLAHLFCSPDIIPFPSTFASASKPLSSLGTLDLGNGIARLIKLIARYPICYIMESLPGNWVLPFSLGPNQFGFLKFLPISSLAIYQSPP